MRRKHRRFGTAIIAVVLMSLSAAARDEWTPGPSVQRWRTANGAKIIRELADFVAVPNLASDKANIARNAQHLLALVRARGAEARLLEEPDAPPVVYGQLRSPGAKYRVTFYAHYDGQ